MPGERDREELTSRLVEAEHQLGRLMNLYVATFQLHATLDPTEVQATIAEIAVDLLGAERFALLLREDGRNECEVALSRGLEDDPSGLYSTEKYAGGDPLVDAALDDGVLRMGPDEFSEAIASSGPICGPSISTGGGPAWSIAGPPGSSGGSGKACSRRRRMPG